MEGNMVEEHRLGPSECLSIVQNHFLENYPDYGIHKKGNYIGYWWIEFINENDKASIYFNGDIGGHFYVIISISGEKFDLWRFDKTVNNYSLSIERNIIFQLSVIDKFLAAE